MYPKREGCRPDIPRPAREGVTSKILESLTMQRTKLTQKEANDPMRANVVVAFAVLLSSSLLLAQEANPRRGKIREAVLKKYDANGNGELDKDERAVFMKLFDANGDGILDRNEKLAVAKEFGGRKEPQENGDGAARGVAPSKWNTVGFQQANTMGGGKADIPESGKLRVFVLMGQSNMHGTARAAKLKPPYTEKHERIRIWANGRWEYFQPRARFGPGVSMAHQLAELWPNDTIGIIKVSVGGTGICAFEKNWTKERADRTFDGKKGALYKDLMNAVAEAEKSARNLYCGFVWKQGGADGTRKDLADEYYDTFELLVSDLRKDLSAPQMPVFVLTYASDEELAEVTLTGKRKNLKAVLMAHNRAGRDIPSTTTVLHGQLPKQEDGVHFNHEGQIALGKMTATAIAEFYKERQ
jgi:hypothetical protein